MNSEMNQPIQSATAEMETPRSAVPVWLVILMVLLLYWGGLYFDQHGGWFSPQVYAPYASVAEVEKFQPPASGGPPPQGRRYYDLICALCHNPDGAGKPGQAPPLVGSEWVLAEGANRLIRIPIVGLNGPIEVKGQQMNLSMAAMGASLSDEDLAAVLTYIRQSWGNKASDVTPEQVKAVRADLANHPQAYMVEELKKLPDKIPSK